MLVERSVGLKSGPVSLLVTREAADLPDDREVEWAPAVPYWSVLWRSGVALAKEVDEAALAGRRVVELGCGLGLPSLAAARAGAEVLATDASEEALELLHENARRNAVEIDTERVEWGSADELVARAPFDVVLAADVLYERASVGVLLALLPCLGGEVWVADPGRPGADAFMAQARRRFGVEARRRGLVTIYRLT